MPIRLFIAAAAGLALFAGMRPAYPPAASGAAADSTAYALVWSDEFNNNGTPDPAKWDYERGFIRNREPQWYRPENAWCKDGMLVIEARKEKYRNPQYDAASKDWRLNREYAEYTSACLITKGKYEFRYGKVVMRAKIDVRQGMWPAFWMLGSNRGPVYWPACGEVDIMEFYRGNLLANLAWEGNKGAAWSERKWPVAQWGGERWAADFHEWVLEWDQNKMVISVDGQVLNTTDLANTVNHKEGNNPFRENFYLLLNLALGQNGEEIPDAHIPARMLVDYVRVYQQPGA
ncbi:glycoside hydrolase family 16 protein [Chitinophaga sp.]|uniref:glycoside hydrolase family 16 protein n=1 Tax=Chitinophaga sp. TaxID=1869181 RepID=UPI0031D1E90E